MIRAKMVLTSITRNHVGGTVYRWDCNYDKSIPEDQRFCDLTPYGFMEQSVNNQKVIEQFNLGDSFYVDLSPIKKDKAND